MSKVTLLSDPPPRRILRPDQLDNLGEAVIALTRELWVLSDRVAVLEALLAKKGVVEDGEVDAFQPDDAQQQDLKTRRERLLRTVETALYGER